MLKRDLFDMHSGNRMNDLKQVLFNEYGGFTDKRIRNLEIGSRFTIDNRRESDISQSGKLYSSFCGMYADVLSPEQVEVILRGKVPVGEEVIRWVENNDCDTEGRNEPFLSFIVDKGNEQILESLAKAIEAIIAPHKRYTVKSYKHVCPETAASLRRLMSVLKRAWNV